MDKLQQPDRPLVHEGKEFAGIAAGDEAMARTIQPCHYDKNTSAPPPGERQQIQMDFQSETDYKYML